MSAVTESLELALKHHQAGELEQAERIYGKILRLDPSHADALHLLGVAAHQRQRHEEAVGYIQRSIDINATDPLSHSNLGAAYRSMGRSNDAADSFRKAIRIDPGFSGAHYNLASEMEALGHTDEAIAGYSESLRLDPDFLDANNNLGNIYAAQQRFDEAVVCFERLTADRPESAESHYNLANAYYGSGAFEKSVESYRTALSLKSDFSQAHNNLGMTLKELKEFDQAVNSFEEALKIDAAFVEARTNLGLALQAKGETDQALVCFRTSAVIHPDRADVQCALAGGLRDAGDLSEAESHYQTALDINPNMVEAHWGLGLMYQKRDNLERARECFQKILQIEPEHTEALNALTSMITSPDDRAGADRYFERVVDLEPDSAAGQFNLGNNLKDQGRAEEAEARYRRALEIAPEFVEAHINLGVVLLRQQRVREAVASHRQAVQRAPDNAEARFHLSLALLTAGEFDPGWSEYESRWQYEVTPREFAAPVWDGSPLLNRTLLVYAEQGVGDEIMFSSCLPDIVGRAAACVVECDPRLVRLFSRSFPLADVVARPIDSEPTDPTHPAFDLQISMGSLPRFFRPNLDAFPSTRRYLAADPQQVEKWRQRFGHLDEGLNIGISWKGGGHRLTRHRRSTPLEQWNTLLSWPGVNFINLQYGDTQEETAAAAERLGIDIHDWNDVNPLEDLDAFAAQISALDLVISVDNSTVHMAGALGVPVWTLLPRASNWRWMCDRNDTPWYSTMKLFRQNEAGNWNDVFERIAGELDTLTGQTATDQTVTGQSATSQSAFSGAIISPTIASQVQDEQDDEVDEVGRQQASEVVDSPAPSVTENSPPEQQSQLMKVIAQPPDDQAAREKRKYETVWEHDDYRKFSPGLQDADKLPLVETLRRFNVQTILDAGCGSGKLMQKLMREHADEFDVHGFDISENCLDPFFDDIKNDVLTLGCLWKPEDFKTEYDAIICTDVMEHIPTEHVPMVLENFHRCTRKICYLSIALFNDGFGPKILGEPLHLTVKSPSWWFAQMSLAGLKIDSHATERTAEGEDVWLHVFATV